MNRLNKDIPFIKKSDKVVIVAAVLLIMVIAVNAAVLDWMLTFFSGSNSLWNQRGQEGFLFSICHSFSFLFFR